MYLHHLNSIPVAYPYHPPQPAPRDNFRRIFSFARIAIIGLFASVTTFWLICRPQQMQIAVSSASLRLFNLSSSSSGNLSLSFDLSTNLSIKNPNVLFSIYYDWLELLAVHEGLQLSLASKPPFHQGQNETTVFLSNFKGQSAVRDLDGYSAVFEREKAAGLFSVDVWVFGQFRYEFGKAMTRWYALTSVCRLRIPMGKKAGFSSIVCEVDT